MIIPTKDFPEKSAHTVEYKDVTTITGDKVNPNHFTEVLLPLFTILQPKFREVMVDLKVADLLFSQDAGYFFVGEWNKLDDINSLRKDIFVLPRTIDDSSEEARKRSLWGMLDHTRFEVEDANNGLMWLMTKNNFDCWKPLVDGKELTPTEALLRALAAQWGVEVE